MIYPNSIREPSTPRLHSTCLWHSGAASRGRWATSLGYVAIVETKHRPYVSNGSRLASHHSTNTEWHGITRHLRRFPYFQNKKVLLGVCSLFYIILNTSPVAVVHPVSVTPTACGGWWISNESATGVPKHDTVSPRTFCPHLLSINRTARPHRHGFTGQQPRRDVATVAEDFRCICQPQRGVTSAAEDHLRVAPRSIGCTRWRDIVGSQPAVPLLCAPGLDILTPGESPSCIIWTVTDASSTLSPSPRPSSPATSVPKTSLLPAWDSRLSTSSASPSSRVWRPPSTPYAAKHTALAASQASACTYSAWSCS